MLGNHLAVIACIAVETAVAISGDCVSLIVDNSVISASTIRLCDAASPFLLYAITACSSSDAASTCAVTSAGGIGIPGAIVCVIVATAGCTDFQNAAIDATVDPVHTDISRETQLTIGAVTTPSAPTATG